MFSLPYASPGGMHRGCSKSHLLLKPDNYSTLGINVLAKITLGSMAIVNLKFAKLTNLVICVELVSKRGIKCHILKYYFLLHGLDLSYSVPVFRWH